MGTTSFKFILTTCVVIFLISGIVYLSMQNNQETERSEPSMAIEEKAAKTSTVMPAGPDNDTTAAHSEKQQPWYNSAMEALKDPDISARVQTVLGLREYPSQETVRLLSRFLDDKEFAVVSEAVDTLGIIGLNDSISNKTKNLILNLLEEKARDKDFSAQDQALVTAALISRNNRMLPVISDYISEHKDTGRDSAVRAMSFIASPECIPYLRTVLDESENPDIHKNALRILVEIDTIDAYNEVVKQLMSLDQEKQACSAWAFSLQNSPEFNEVLRSVIADHKLKREGLSVVATSKAAPAVFSELFQDDNIKNEDKISWLKVIAKNTVESPSAIRSGVASVVEPLLQSDDTDLEIQAIKTLGELGAEQDSAAQVLAEKFTSSNQEVRSVALEAFYSYCTPDTYKELQSLWWDQDENIRRTAFSMSENFLESSDIEVLEKATKHEDEFIIEHSRSILRQLP